MVYDAKHHSSCIAGWAAIIANKVATKKELEVVHQAVNSLNAEALRKAAEQAQLKQEAAVSTASLQTGKEAMQTAASVEEKHNLAMSVQEKKWQAIHTQLLEDKVNLEKQLLLKQQQEHPDRDPGLLSE